MQTSTSTESGLLNAETRAGRSAVSWLLLGVPFAYVWYRLIDNLWPEWATDPQYSYSLVVPLLVLGLLFRRWRRYFGIKLRSPNWTHPGLLITLFALLAFLYLPTRLIEEAVPEWRPIGWLLAIVTIGLTLCALYVAAGEGGLKRFAFPLCFFLVAVPWPTLFEHPIIQGLGRANAAAVVNILSIIGVPAIQHGNVIEVSTGLVGINDACSGIRSIQSSLMISLFLGEFYFIRWTRRLLLVPAGFALAMFFNICRTSLLTFIAAKDGVPAIARYHDEAGVTIMLACTVTLWAVSYLASLRNGRQKLSDTEPAPGTVTVAQREQGGWRPSLAFLAAALMVWIGLAEAGVWIWSAVREAHIRRGPDWALVFPENNPTFKTLPFTESEHELLRFDDGKQGEWQDADGTTWRAFYFDWRPGRVAGYLAKRHTPDICLPATGLKMVSGPKLMMLDIHGIVLPMRSYVFKSSDGPLNVYQCCWGPGENRASIAEESSRFNLIRSVWAGRGNKGQKVIEFVIGGCSDSAAAKHELIRELNRSVEIETSEKSTGSRGT